jgi:hypothetical protein
LAVLPGRFKLVVGEPGSLVGATSKPSARSVMITDDTSAAGPPATVAAFYDDAPIRTGGARR